MFSLAIMEGKKVNFCLQLLKHCNGKSGALFLFLFFCFFPLVHEFGFKFGEGKRNPHQKTSPVKIRLIDLFLKKTQYPTSVLSSCDPVCE